MWLRGTNFCINWTSSVCLAPSFMQLRNDPKCTQILWYGPNISFGSNGLDWVRSLRKIPMWLRGTNFCINCTISRRFALCFLKLWNHPKCTQTHQNMRLGSNGVDHLRSFRKITTWLPGTNFCINWTSSVCFATSFMQLRNDPKCTQILQNAQKH
jgi:hypothetical protein